LKSLVTLHLAVLHDAGLLCDTNVERDKDSILSRSEHEGESFLTITLPLFAKALEKGLHDGVWPRHELTSYKYVRGLPAFLRGFLTRVFSDDGGILDAPDTNSIWAIRQICNLSGKIERACTPERVDNAFSTFITTDRELGNHFRQGIPEWAWTAFEKNAFALFGDVFDSLEKTISSFDLIPRHGPGAVADRLDHAQRWDFDYWPERLQEVFPSWRYSVNQAQSFTRDTVPIETELPVRVVAVPKTQKTPRIIAIEPSTMQFAQQGLKRELYRLIGDSPLAAILGFTDQERNQILAREGSISGDLATLDLSEASDRVHLSTVIRLFSKWPHLREFVLAARSRYADVRGETILLHKFASMGSALTFPIEAIIFTIIASMGVEPTAKPSVRQLVGRVSVYGDDIVVPRHTVSDVVALLEIFGFKVNKHKSFWNGHFRESCGKEYYNGDDVSVVRLRAEVPTSRQDAALVNRFTDFRNRCFRAGLWRTVKSADEILSNIISIPSRHVKAQIADPLGAMALDTTLRTKWRGKLNSDLQMYEEHYPKAIATASTFVVDGEGGLLKWFLENHDRTSRYQTDKYEGQERAHTFRIKWVRAECLPKHSVV